MANQLQATAPQDVPPEAMTQYDFVHFNKDKVIDAARQLLNIDYHLRKNPKEAVERAAALLYQDYVNSLKIDNLVDTYGDW